MVVVSVPNDVKSTGVGERKRNAGTLDLSCKVRKRHPCVSRHKGIWSDPKTLENDAVSCL